MSSRAYLNIDKRFKDHWIEESRVKIGNTVGAGSFGKVYAGTYNDIQVAIKVYDRIIFGNLSISQKENMLKEFELMKQLINPFTVRVYGLTTVDNCLAIVMEFGQGGTLKNLIENPVFRADVELQYCILRDIAYGMKYIHSQNIVHRDIKPANILIFEERHSKFRAKVSDYGESKVRKQSLSTKFSN